MTRNRPVGTPPGALRHAASGSVPRVVTHARNPSPRAASRGILGRCKISPAGSVRTHESEVPVRARRLRGFTLIEILVVVAIMAVLGSLMLGALLKAGERARIALTRANIANLRGALVAYEADAGRLPRRPGPPTAASVFQNDIAWAYAALRNRRTAAHGGGLNAPYVEWKAEHLGVTPAAGAATPVGDAAFGAVNVSGRLPQTLYEPLGDGDALALHDSAFQLAHLPASAQPLVFLDPWGNPLFYREWASVPTAMKDAAVRTATSNLGVGGTGSDETHPDRPHDPSRCDVWSFGPNGVNEWGEGDDITSWGAR